MAMLMRNAVRLARLHLSSSSPAADAEASQGTGVEASQALKGS